MLRAFTTRARSLDWAAVPPDAIERALQIGLGPVLAHAAHIAGATRHLHFADRVHAAELTARVLTAEKFHTLSDVLNAARGIDCRLVLLKGAATALSYYPEPHLRTMGDIDVLVPAEHQSLLEAKLRSLGLQQHSSEPAETFVGRHHSMPFCDVQRGTWVDVHSKLCPPEHPMAADALFSWVTVNSHLLPVTVGMQTAFTMDHERQLIYTSTRWADTFNPGRGLYPILDAALLIQKHGDTLDWDVVLATIRKSWAATALHLMLSCLDRWELAVVPPAVLNTLVTAEHRLNRFSIRLLHRLITEYVVEGRPFGLAVTTQGHLEKMWNSLLGPRSPTANLLSVPYHIAFPLGHPERFSPLYAMRRVGVFVRRAVLKRSRGRDA
jgi:hypothetical protein